MANSKTLADMELEHAAACEEYPGGHRTLYDFVRLAERWNALGKRAKAAAVAMNRGSLDTTTDLLGTRDEANASPAWDELFEMLFDIEEAGFRVDNGAVGRLDD
jgi:hypothetical protein